MVLKGRQTWSRFKKFVKKKLRHKRPLEIVVGKIKETLEHWKKDFPDFQVEEIVVDMRLGGKLLSWKAGLLVTLKKKDS